MPRPSHVLLAAIVALLAALALACGQAMPDAESDRAAAATGAGACEVLSEGCRCETVGATTECGVVLGRSEGWVRCAKGTRTCLPTNEWGACETPVTSADDTWTQTASLRPLGLGTPARCGGADACDPTCRMTADDAVQLDAGTAFKASDGGLSLAGTPLATTCTSLTIQGSATSITVTGLDPVTPSPSAITFTAQLLPAGCYTGTFPVVWTVDAPDSAAMAGSTSTDGRLTLVRAVSRVLKVSALADGKVVSTNIPVTVNATTTGAGVTAAMTQALSSGPEVSDSLAILYPYDRVVLPLGMLAPVLQWTPALAGSAVQIALKYSTTGVSFAWTGTMTEPTGPRYTIPQAMWTAFEQTARGATGQITLRRTSGTNRTTERVINVIFANGSLKGTVYYNSYNSPLASNTGAVLAVRPSSTTGATVLKGGCTVCHSVSANGSRLVSGLSWSGADPTNSGTFDIASTGAVTAGYSQRYGAYAFAALTPDGKYMMTHSNKSGGVRGLSTLSGNYSVLLDPVTGATVATTGWSATAQAQMPSFSPDGKYIVFTDRVLNSSGYALNAMAFDQATLKFTSLGQTGIYKGTKKVGWPSFLADSRSVVFHEGDAFDSAKPNKADIEIADIVTKTRSYLPALNGMAGTDTTLGAYYLPYGETSEGHLNYEPTALPVSSAGYYWVVFTSRRCYGNVLTSATDPWGKDASTTELSPRKKLWVAAIDMNATAGQDRSHPAFYLPGQELAAGNMRGFWALDPCQSTGGTCDTDDDCCGGLTTPKTTQCRIDIGSSPITRHCAAVTNRCAAIGESCGSASDCCTAGAICNVGQCALPEVFQTGTYTRDFEADCRPGATMKWRNFDWQSVVPSGTSIDFRAQTADTSAGLAGATSYAVATASATTTTWVSSARTVDQILRANGATSRRWLRISMTFNPTRLATPALTNWRQLFSCVDNE